MNASWGQAMNTPRFFPEFKKETVREIVDRGYPVSEVAERLGVSAHSCIKWVKAVRLEKSQEQAAELVAAKSLILKQVEGRCTRRELLAGISHSISCILHPYAGNHDKEYFYQLQTSVWRLHLKYRET